MIAVLLDPSVVQLVVSLALAASVWSNRHEPSPLFYHSDLIWFTHFVFCDASLIELGSLYKNRTIILYV